MDEVKIGEILLPGDDETIRSREKRVRERLWETVRRAAGQIPFMEDVVAGYYCALDRETPIKVRGILLAALAYFILPLDTIPDFILGLGFTDDLAVLTAAITAIRSHITPAHRSAARKALEQQSRGRG